MLVKADADAGPPSAHPPPSRRRAVAPAHWPGRRAARPRAVAPTYLPGYFVSSRVVLQGNGEVSSLIKFPERCGLGWSLFKCSCGRRASHLQRKQSRDQSFKRLKTKTGTVDGLILHEIFWTRETKSLIMDKHLTITDIWRRKLFYNHGEVLLYFKLL